MGRNCWYQISKLEFSKVKVLKFNDLFFFWWYYDLKPWKFSFFTRDIFQQNKQFWGIDP